MPQDEDPTKRPDAVRYEALNEGQGAPTGGRANRLSSWKEIAAYLDCDERTCLRWEKSYGLPIHRIEGSKKSRVFAFRDEIDRWQREKSYILNGKAAADSLGPGSPIVKSEQTQKTSEAGRRKQILPRAAWTTATVVLIVAAAALMIALSLSVPRVPKDFRIDGSALVILNEKGKELWRYDTGFKSLDVEKYRRSFTQPRAILEEGHVALPHIAFNDLDGDGRLEVLFNVQTLDGYGPGVLMCFSQKGKLLWEFPTGFPVEVGGKRFSGDFLVRGFDVDDLNGDGAKEIVVIGHQWHRFPTRLAVLDAKGELLGDYWHAGHLTDLLFLDLDGDGRKEILAAGTNNEYGQGVLVVFDSADVRGSSPQFTERYAWKDFGPGSELHYIRIPRTDAELADYFPQDAISRIMALKSGEISVWSGRSVIEYVFDRSLKIREVRSSHSFQVLHENARRAGKISSVSDAAYFEDLRRRVLYWDGSGWTPDFSLAVAKNRNKRK